MEHLYFENITYGQKWLKNHFNQKQFTGWILVAKRTETKNRRIKEGIELLEKNKKLGLR